MIAVLNHTLTRNGMEMSAGIGVALYLSKQDMVNLGL
jgi:hypothetical protein